MPTLRRVKKRLFEALPDQVSGTILELGSGWGTLLLPLAKKYPQAKIIGYEISLIPYWVSKMRVFFTRKKNIILQRKDFFSQKLPDADLIVCYLFPKAMARLEKKLERKKGILISHTFSMPTMRKIKEITVNDLYQTKIYFY